MASADGSDIGEIFGACCSVVGKPWASLKKSLRSEQKSTAPSYPVWSEESGSQQSPLLSG